MRRIRRTADASPSMANGVPISDALEPLTNVIKGCAEAVAAPRRRRADSSSLASAPLECSATVPRQLPLVISELAARAIWLSGTQNQTTPDLIRAWVPATARAPT